MKKILKTCLLHSTAVGVTLFGLSLGVRAQQTPADEISPPVTDLLYGLEQMFGPDSTLVETQLEGFEEKYGDAVRNGDHIQGIAMTAGGQIVLSYSRQDPSKENCSGMLIYSSPFDPASPNRELDWDFYCETSNTDINNPPTGLGPEAHPSSLQASGNILAVGTHGGTRFYYLGPNGIEALHPNTAVRTGGRDSTGLTYNPVDRRFYLLNSDGSTAVGKNTIRLCRSDQDISLRQANQAIFTDSDCININDVYVSGQGANLIVQEDGTLFLVSTFSTRDLPDNLLGFADDNTEAIWGAYGTRCAIETLSLPGYGFRASFEDHIYISKLDFSNRTADLVRKRDIRRTQAVQTCVDKRPAFRFAGGVATIRNGALLGLWSGRQNPPLLPLNDSYEFAFQDLPQPIKSASVSEEKAYLFRENNTYYRYTDSQGVDPGYPASTSRNWDFDVEGDDKEILGAVRYDNGHVYLFLEDGYYSRLEKDGSTSPGYPVKITDSNWPGLAPYAEDIKAVINWGNGFIYFFIDTGPFRDGRYVRYNIAENKIDQEPKLVEGPWGILGDYNDDISAAVNWGNGKAYFFIEGGEYIRWDIDTGETAGPTRTSKYWPGVSDDEDITAAFRHQR